MLGSPSFGRLPTIVDTIFSSVPSVHSLLPAHADLNPQHCSGFHVLIRSSIPSLILFWMGALKNTEILAGHAIPAERHSGQKQRLHQREALNGGIPTNPADTKGLGVKG